MATIKKLKMNYQPALMAAAKIPQFSWVLASDAGNVVQTAYQLQIARDKDFKDLVYDSDIVESDQSAHIQVPEDIKLESATRYYVQASADTNAGFTGFCEPVSFLTGLLCTEEWQASFISAEKYDAADRSNATCLRKEFHLRGPVKEAVVYATALGLYKLYLNGSRVGDAELAPGWTSYNKHLLYQTYDITDQLKTGDNAIGAMVGAGWYKGKMGFVGKRNLYGKRTALLVQMIVRYEDGSEDLVVTDDTWQGADAPITFAEIYDGETYNASLEQPGWLQPGFAAENWHPAERIDHDFKTLAAQEASPVREMETLPVKDLFITPQGDTVLDFGQNLSGWIHFRASGKKGDKVELNCFEALDKDGNVYLDNLRGAKQTITYTFGRDGEVSFNPSFTFMGFRYAKIAAWPGEPKQEQFEVRVLYSDMEETGSFTSSNSDLNKLNQNVTWSLKGNFVDIPTDCPQRNERLGWTGDAQIFARTATYLMNSYTFFEKWLTDVAADQTPEGGVPHVVPDILTGQAADDWLLSQGTHSAAAWADVAVIMPWAMYLNFGDQAIIHKQYNSMKSWIDFMQQHANDYIWNYKLQFGDWVALDAEEGSYFGATPNDLTCTAYFAYSTGLFAKMAGIIGKKEDAAQYNTLYKNIVDKYQRTFFDDSGAMKVQTQTAHIVSLYFNLVPEAYKQKTIDGLMKLLEKENGHLVTGFVGTPYFCHALSQNGQIDAAFDLLMRDDFPSWLYQVKMGATTIWEHWDGIKPDGSMWSADMNSFNHYAYGAIDEWIYRVLGGLETDEAQPGFKHSLIQPHIGGGLSFAETSYLSPYGKVATHWERQGDDITLAVTIPHNTTATIKLDRAESVLANGGLVFKKDEAGQYQAEAGSGVWQIKYRM